MLFCIWQYLALSSEVFPPVTAVVLIEDLKRAGAALEKLQDEKGIVVRFVIGRRSLFDELKLAKTYLVLCLIMLLSILQYQSW